MGDYADVKRITNTHATLDATTAQHKPLPKGSDGSKPRPRRPGEKPRPKKSGVMFDAHNHAEPATREHDAIEHLTGPTEGATASCHDGFKGDGPGKAASHNSKGKFLNEEQRGRIENMFMGRVLAAQSSYMTELSNMHADNLIQKPEELSIWTALFIAALGKVTEFAVMSALMDLKKVGKAVHALKEAKVMEVKESEVEGKILGLNEKTVEGLVGLGVDKGKEKITEKKTEAQNEAGQEEQTAKGSYIEYLQDNSMMMFQHLREDRLSSASDAELVAAMVTFEGSRWTHTILHARLQAHVDVFMKSHAKDIGHRNEKADADPNLDNDHSHAVRKEVRVAWVINGRKERQLVYMGKEFRSDDERGVGGTGKGAADPENIYEPGNEMDRPGPAYTASETALGLEEEGTWHDSRDRHEAVTKTSHMPKVEPEFLGPVEAELQETALAAHKKRWLQAPETIMKGPYGWIVVAQ
jgi:hypothetical protein